MIKEINLWQYKYQIIERAARATSGSCYSWHKQTIYRASGVKLFLCCHVKGRRDLSAEHSMRIMMSVGSGDVFIVTVSICCFLIAGAGCIRPLLLVSEPAGPERWLKLARTELGWTDSERRTRLRVSRQLVRGGCLSLAGTAARFKNSDWWWSSFFRLKLK